MQLVGLRAHQGHPAKQHALNVPILELLMCHAEHQTEEPFRTQPKAAYVPFCLRPPPHPRARARACLTPTAPAVCCLSSSDWSSRILWL